MYFYIVFETVSTREYLNSNVSASLLRYQSYIFTLLTTGLILNNCLICHTKQPKNIQYNFHANGHFSANKWMQFWHFVNKIKRFLVDYICRTSSLKIMSFVWMKDQIHVFNPFNTEWTPLSIVYSWLKTSVDVKALTETFSTEFAKKIDHAWKQLCIYNYTLGKSKAKIFEKTLDFSGHC